MDVAMHNRLAATLEWNLGAARRSQNPRDRARFEANAHRLRKTYGLV